MTQYCLWNSLYQNSANLIRCALLPFEVFFETNAIWWLVQDWHPWQKYLRESIFKPTANVNQIKQNGGPTTTIDLKELELEENLNSSK